MRFFPVNGATATRTTLRLGDSSALKVSGRLVRSPCTDAVRRRVPSVVFFAPPSEVRSRRRTMSCMQVPTKPSKPSPLIRRPLALQAPVMVVWVCARCPSSVCRMGRRCCQLLPTQARDLIRWDARFISCSTISPEKSWILFASLSCSSYSVKPVKPWSP